MPTNKAERNRSFTDIYLQYHRRMLGYAYNILKNREDAEDAVADMFTSLITRMGKVSRLEDREITNYLLRATRNTSLTYLEKREKRSELSKTEIYDTDGREDERLLSLLGERDSTEAIRSLPILYRELMYMHYVEEMTVKSISKETTLSVSCVKQRLVRGKAMLIKELERRGKSYEKK